MPHKKGAHNDGHISFSFVLPICLKLYMFVSIHYTNAYYILDDSHKYFYLAAIFMFHIYDQLCVPYLRDIVARYCIFHLCMYVCMQGYIHMPACMSLHAYMCDQGMLGESDGLTEVAIYPICALHSEGLWSLPL